MTSTQPGASSSIIAIITLTDNETAAGVLVLAHTLQLSEFTCWALKMVQACKTFVS